jgi:hypothetical protein
MKKRCLILLALYIFILCNRAAAAATTVPQDKFAGSGRTLFYPLGHKQIALKITAYGSRKDIVMINLHDDETTGVNAAKSVLEKTGGILLSIENKGQRYITFTQRGKTFRFDPNRIFTRSGIKATLLEQNKYSTKSAIKAIHGFARFLLSKVPRISHVLIALHNNNDHGLSIFTYIGGGDYEKDAAAVNRSDIYDPDNFFLTTDKRLFQLLRSAGYNAVLQNNKKAKDDGSLSIYYGRRNKRYVNIEAEKERMKEQKEMIEMIISFIQAPYARIYRN